MESTTPTEENSVSSKSRCLLLHPDVGDNDSSTVQEVMFERTDAPTDAAAALLSLPVGERVRCFHCPMFERALGWSVHLYVDLQGVEHHLPHNSNASQLWLVANLPDEPPQVTPDSIHGPVLLVAEDCKTEELVDLGLADWRKLADTCRQVQPNALFSGLLDAPAAKEVEA